MERNPDDLLSLIRAKLGGGAGLPPAATPAELREAERRLGFELFPWHARLLLEIADGGFGPSEIYGVGPHGFRDGERGGLVEFREELAGADGRHLPPQTAPLCDLGCGCWVIVNSRSGELLAVDEYGTFETSYDLLGWMSGWLAGDDVAGNLFDHTRAPIVAGINPFTRQPMSLKGRGPLKGRRVL